MKIGLASESKLPTAYAPKTLDNHEQVTLQVGSEKLTIATNSFQSVANILAMFAPDGNATLEPGTTFYLRDGFSDKETSITANALIDVAQALSKFAVKPGKYIPALKDIDEDKNTSKKTNETASIAQEVVTPIIAEKDHVSAEIEKPKKRGRKPKEQAIETAENGKEYVPQVVEPALSAEAPPKRRGRPPKNRVVAETNAETGPKTTKPRGRPKKAEMAPATEAKATNAAPALVPHSSGGPFPAAMTANHTNPQIVGDVPDFIKKLKAFYIIGENEEYRFDFTALKMDPTKRRTVTGPADAETAESNFGYEVKSKAGEHIGWIIIEAENKFVMAGIPEMEISSHRNIEGPITKTGIAIANKVASIRAKAA